MIPVLYVSATVCLLGAGERGVPVADFEGENALAGWTFWKDPSFAGADGKLATGAGHTGGGAVLAYRFACRAGTPCGGAVGAMWTPPKAMGVKRKGAVSLWVRATPEVKLAVVVKERDGASRRYPFEAAALEHAGGEWRRVVVPLAARSTGYWDEDHTGAPEGRVSAIGIVAEARWEVTMEGSVAFDEVKLLETPNEEFVLTPDAALVPAAEGAQRLGTRLGVNVHTLGDERILDAARGAGFQFVRADLLWRAVERNGGYRFGGYDRLLSALEARGMGVLWILDYGHPQHGGDVPRGPDAVAAFARFAEAAAAHFRGRHARYEVWNEPNTEHFWGPRPDAAEYAALLRAAVEAVHRGDPEAQVASGGLSRMDLRYLEAVIAAGGAANVNAAGVHPYRKAGPEGLAAEWPAMKQLVARSLGERVQVWDTEWGYASYDYFSQNLRGDGHSTEGRKRQAVLASREVLTVWALGLPVAVWYDLRDDGDDPKNPEHNYGLLDRANGEKPAMGAVRAVTSLGRDHTYAGMVEGVPDGLHAMRLDGSGERVFAVWSDQPDARTTLRFRMEGFAGATDLMGEPLKVKKGGRGVGEVGLAETEGPVYLRFAGS